MAVRNTINYLECHATVHDWDEVSVLKAPTFGIAIDSRCTVCHATRRVLISRTTGEVLSRIYHHEKDYRGPVGMSKADYRKLWLEEKLRKQRKLKAV